MVCTCWYMYLQSVLKQDNVIYFYKVGEIHGTFSEYYDEKNYYLIGFWFGVYICIFLYLVWNRPLVALNLVLSQVPNLLFHFQPIELVYLNRSLKIIIKVMSPNVTWRHQTVTRCHHVWINIRYFVRISVDVVIMAQSDYWQGYFSIFVGHIDIKGSNGRSIKNERLIEVGRSV